MNAPDRGQEGIARESEAEQVRRAQAGDREAFVALVERHLPGLYRFVARELHYHEALGTLPPGEVAVEDLVDEVCLTALRDLHRMPGRASFKGWLRLLALRAVRRAVRRSRLRRQLPKALAERVAGELSVSLKAGLDDILAQVLAVEQAVERRFEAERVRALLEAALGQGPGVLGLESTLAAVVQERVQLLVVEEDFRQPGWECPHCGYLGLSDTERCPLCETALDPQLDIVERAVERALDQRATLEVLRGEARQALAAHGHIGALLRYAG